jgi:Tol biopolymer transport system component
MGWVFAQDRNEERIAFVSFRDGNQEIYTRSPDGTKIAFYSVSIGGSEEIFVLNGIDQSLVRITDDEILDYHPAWSPNSNQLAFTSIRNHNQDIYILALETHELVRITDDPSYDGGVDWWGNRSDFNRLS